MAQMYENAPSDSNADGVGGQINRIYCDDDASHGSTIEGGKYAAQIYESVPSDAIADGVGGQINTIYCDDNALHSVT